MRGAHSVKIGIVSPYAYPRPGGANAHIRETYTRLRDLGHEVLWLEMLHRVDPTTDRRRIDEFFRRMRSFGLEGSCVVLLFGDDNQVRFLWSIHLPPQSPCVMIGMTCGPVHLWIGS